MPLRRGVPGARCRRPGHVAPLHELEREADAQAVDVLGRPLVEDEQPAAGVLPQCLGVGALGGGELVAPHRQVGQAHVARAPAHPAGPLGQAAGEVALPGAGAALGHHVRGGGHEPARAGLAGQHRVQAPPPVDHRAHLRVREPRPRPRRQAPDARRALPLAGAVHHRPDAVLERRRHHGPVGLPEVGRPHHLAHPRLARLAARLLVDHPSRPRRPACGPRPRSGRRRGPRPLGPPAGAAFPSGPRPASGPEPGVALRRLRRGDLGFGGACAHAASRRRPPYPFEGPGADGAGLYARSLIFTPSEMRPATAAQHGPTPAARLLMRASSRSGRRGPFGVCEGSVWCAFDA